MSLPHKLSSWTRRILLSSRCRHHHHHRRCPNQRHQSTATLLDRLSQRLSQDENPAVTASVGSEATESEGECKDGEESSSSKTAFPILSGAQRRQMIRETLIDPTADAHRPVLFHPAPIYFERYSHLPPKFHVGRLTGKLYSLPEPLVERMKEIALGYELNQLMVNATALTEELSKRKIPPEEDKIQQLVDERILKMATVQRSPDQATTLVLNKEEGELRKQLIHEMKSRYAWCPAMYVEKRQVVQYMVGRMAADYAAIAQVFRELGKRFPRFSPTHLLDYGSGTGSVIWAANRRWSETLVEQYCVEVSPVMREWAEKLMRVEIEPDWREPDVDLTQRKKNRFRGMYFRPSLPVTSKRYQLATSTFTLMDLPSAKARLKAVETMWLCLQPYGFLVLVENGTKHGYDVLQEAREFINDSCRRAETKWMKGPRNADNGKAALFIKGRHRAFGRCKTVAPCPHNSPCPLYSFSAKKALCATSAKYVPAVSPRSGKSKPSGKGKPEPEVVEYSFLILQKLPTDVELREAVDYRNIRPPMRSGSGSNGSRLGSKI